MNTYVISTNLSECAAGTYLLWQAPTDAQGGGVTILSGAVVGGGTVTARLHTFSDAGTPALNGTITAAVGGTIAAGVPAAFTVSDGWVDGSEWVGVVLVGTLLDGTFLHVKYAMGR
jgi:hypothetical protein